MSADANPGASSGYVCPPQVSENIPPQPRPANATAPQRKVTLADFFADPKITEMLSFLIAKLEQLKYETRNSIFRTDWAKSAFYKGLRDIKPALNSKIFDIDLWFRMAKQEALRASPEYIEADQMSADIRTNWMDPLLTLEQSVPGFLKLLYGVLQLEDAAHVKMATLVEHNKNGYDTQKVGTHPALLTYR